MDQVGQSFGVTVEAVLSRLLPDLCFVSPWVCTLLIQDLVCRDTPCVTYLTLSLSFVCARTSLLPVSFRHLLNSWIFPSTHALFDRDLCMTILIRESSRTFHLLPPLSVCFTTYLLVNRQRSKWTNSQLLEEVATWTQMSPDVSGPFFKIIGATGQEHSRTLGMMEEDEVLAETTQMTINDSPLTSMQNCSIRSVAHGRYITIQEQEIRRRASGKAGIGDHQACRTASSDGLAHPSSSAQTRRATRKQGEGSPTNLFEGPAEARTPSKPYAGATRDVRRKALPISYVKSKLPDRATFIHGRNFNHLLTTVGFGAVGLGPFA